MQACHTAESRALPPALADIYFAVVNKAPLYLALEFAKHFGGERLQLGALLPCVRRQPRLQAGLCEKGFAVPFPLDGNLWQQQSTAIALGDDKSVLADDDLFRTNWLQG
jgi:hypothetical protein